MADLCDDRTEFVGKVSECHFAVTVVEFDTMALLNAFVGFGSEAREDMDGIKRESPAGLFEGVDDAIAGALQDDDEKEPTCHRKSSGE